MNILLTSHEHLDPNSGAGGSTLKLGQEYQRWGHQVTYYSYQNLPQSLPDAVKYLLFPWWLGFYLWRHYEQFDVVDANTGDAWVWGKWLAKLVGDPPLLVARSIGLEHIAHLQNLEDAARGDLSLSWKYYLYRGGIRLWEVAQSLRHADLVYLLNSGEHKYAESILNIAPEKLHLVANGIPDYFLNLPLPSPATDKICIAQIGTFIPRKGIKYSVPAINQILCRYPQVEVTFLGTACPECPSPQEVYDRFDPEVRDRITVIPRFNHQELPQLLQNHHIKLLPSLSEGFGKALIEAMACGLAPVATATGGPLDIVSDRYNGFLVPLRDSHKLEQVLAELITNPDKLAKLRQNAYYTAQKYSWRALAKDRLDLYHHAMSQ